MRKWVGLTDTNHAIMNKIETRYIYPPIPDRNYDWEAAREWWDLGDPIGYGPTEQAAIDDLLRIESDNN